MCKNCKFKFLSLLLAFVTIVSFVNTATAQTTVFTYQGKLTDAGNPASGSYQLQFKLYDAISGGAQIGATISDVAVNATGGIFTTRLDFGAAVFSGADRFLEISVRHNASEAYVQLSPRQQIASSPYSIRTLSAASADALSGSCVGCVTSAQINSINGAKVTGTVANAASAQNVTGVVGVSNGGTGLSSSGAAGNFLRSGGGTWTSSALQAADIPVGSANYIQNQSATAQPASMRITGQIRTGNLLRVGSETGTVDAPGEFIPGGYNGQVVRRIDSRSLSGVVARTDVLQLYRDGTAAGFGFSFGATLTSPQMIHCTGMNSAKATVNVRIKFPAGTPSSGIQLYRDDQNMEYFQCSFGDTFNAGHVTQIILQRYENDNYWMGTIISTFNQ